MITRLFLICTLYLLFALLLYRYCHSKRCSEKITFIIELFVLFLSVYLNLFLALLTPTGDSVYFSSVMARLTENGFFGFYDNAGITYPPLFNYLFFLLAKLLTALGVPLKWSYRAFVFGVKLPGIICVFLMAALIFQTARRYLPEKKQVLPLFLILLNPGYMLVTSYICQIDALYSFFSLLTLYLIVNKHLKTAYFAFAAGILFKFQTLFIGPVLVFAIIDQVLLRNFSWKRFFSHLFTGLSAIACMIASYIPFLYDFHSKKSGEQPLLYNFTTSVSGYGRASTNAYNFWTLSGRNLRYDTETFGPLSCSAFGMIFLILLVGACIFFFFRNRRDISIYPLLAAFLVSGIFCFSVRMMARYLYPALALLILSYAMKPSRNRFLCAVSFSAAFLLNVWCDYLVYPYAAYHDRLILPYVISAYMLGCFAWLFYTLFEESLNH